MEYFLKNIFKKNLPPLHNCIMHFTNCWSCRHGRHGQHGWHGRHWTHCREYIFGKHNLPFVHLTIPIHLTII